MTINTVVFRATVTKANQSALLPTGRAHPDNNIKFRHSSANYDDKTKTAVLMYLHVHVHVLQSYEFAALRLHQAEQETRQQTLTH